jgi:quinol monooxygenase YgiN
MTITEIALLRLAPNITIDNANLRSKLAHAKMVMQNYTKHTFYYFQQVEDPSLIYILGEWDSLDQHTDHFIPSQENQEVLQSLEGILTVEWLQHIDASHADLPLPKTDVEKDTARSGEVLLGVARHFVKDGERADFQRFLLRDYVARGELGGWRLDKQDDQEEWVLFCWTTDGLQHERYIDVVGLDALISIQQRVNDVEFKRAKLLDI